MHIIQVLRVLFSKEHKTASVTKSRNLLMKKAKLTPYANKFPRL